MKLLRKILFPVVPIYYGVTWCRNLFYDKGVFESMSYNFPIICVGNLSVGGTGKTPMIEYLIRLLKDNNNVATLSRGYKRTIDGFQIADHTSTASTIGDEPFQFYQKFEDIIVSVDSDRQNGISRLQQIQSPPEIILLDDAFQHRKVKAGLNILLTTYDNLYINDISLPTGDLREPRSGARRADVIVVTKCPSDLNEQEQSRILNLIKPLDGQDVFFSTIKYADEVISSENSLPIASLKDKKFTLVTGIANATPLVSYLKNKGLNFEHLNFKDHHAFTNDEIEAINKHDFVLTTEKDYMRLKSKVLSNKLHYLPIEVNISDSEKFNKIVKSFVKSY